MDVLLAPDEPAGKRRDLLAPIPGLYVPGKVKRQDVFLIERRRVKILKVNRRPDRVNVAAQDAAGGIDGKEDTASGRGIEGRIYRVIRIRWRHVAGADTAEGIGA